jgi:methyltransferase (TIGR00027 family)
MVLADALDSDIQDLFALIPAACARVARVLPNQRARFAEEEVERAIHREIEQYVILGAGLDSFAWRRTDLMAKIELFEVDHPDTQEWKRQRMRVAALRSPANLHLVPIDFEKDQLQARMMEAGFDRNAPSIWSWMGVVVYLEVGSVESTLRAAADLAASGSRMLASYTVTSDLMDVDSREFDQLARAASAEGGEDHITALAPQEFEAIAREAGWRTADTVDISSFAAWFSGRDDGLTAASYERILIADM